MNNPDPTVRSIRPETQVDTLQRLPYFLGLSGRTVNASGLSMHLVVIPPGGRSEPHLHVGYETGIYVLQGEVLTRWGPTLEHQVVSRAGEFLFVPPGVPHEAVNLSVTQPARAVVARNDPAEQDKVQPYVPGAAAVPMPAMPEPGPVTPDVAGFTVRPMTLADASDWAAYAALAESNRFVSSVTRSAADIVPMIERSQSPSPDAPVLFTVREPHSNRLVATVGFHSVSSLNRSAEITYTVDPARWGQGLATQACRAALQWALRHRQWMRVQATTLEAHRASQRVLLKCGFVYEGTLRNFRLVGGVSRDFRLYAAVPAEAAAGAAS